MQAPNRNGLIEAWDPQRCADPLPSPCISVCTMNTATGLCDGCFRTLDEIAEWSAAGDTRKREIWLAVRQRYRAAE